MAKLPYLRALEAFEAVGCRGSVTEAAVELNVSPGAISQQIRKIEEALGVKLLARRGSSLELTSWGRIYYGEVGPALDRIRNAEQVLRRARIESGIAVSCLPSLAAKWLGPQLFDWQSSHPSAAVRLIGTMEEPRFGNGQADFRITYGNNARNFSHYVELFTDWVVPACAPSLLQNHPVKRPADILDSPLLGIDWGTNQGVLPSWSDWAASIGVEPQRRPNHLIFSLSGAAIDAAVNGRGFVLGQLSMIADDIASGRLVVPVDHRIKLPVPYYLCWDYAALEKPFGPELRAWILRISNKQGASSAPERDGNCQRANPAGRMDSN